MSLDIEIKIESDQRKIFSLAGSLDTNTAPQLEDVLEREIDSEVQVAIMDMNKLEFLSSAGIRIIFKAKKLMDARKGKFMLVNLQPQVRKVFEIIKVLDIMEVFSNQAELDDYLEVMQKKVLDQDA
ncbi:MAG: STAS domain-containing protein [Gammaproteobacteria bacterium]|nr:STAS domain-containing protein [Gammaproteobacteria bacterium]MDX2487483.1 STAS domain-containing protein [Gammaproteobacteria bacterium]